MSLIDFHFIGEENDGVDTSTNPQVIRVEDDGYVHVIGLINQSNGLGFNTSGDTSQNTDVQAYNNSGNWVTANLSQAPFNAGNNNMHFHFCKNLAEKYNVKVRLQLVARPGETIDNYEREKYMYQWVLADRKRMNMPPASICLNHQGEQDNGTANTYISRFDAVIENAILDGLIREDAKIIVGETTESTAINAQLNIIGARGVKYGIALGTDLDNSASTSGLIHYTGENLVIMGARYFAEWEYLMD